MQNTVSKWTWALFSDRNLVKTESNLGYVQRVCKASRFAFCRTVLDTSAPIQTGTSKSIAYEKHTEVARKYKTCV